MNAPRLILPVTLLLAGILIGFGYGRWYGPRAEAGAEQSRKPKGYHCPMHPHFRSDKPGDCGICGMRLVPDDAPGAAGHEAPHAESRKILHYRDPHNPEYKSDKPGVNPETGNDLEPVYDADPPAMPAGTIHVSPHKQQLIGVQYGVAASTAGVHTFRAVGKVALDETRVAKVQTKIDGWVDKVFVDFTGKHVEKGQPLLTLYSPEMLASQQEYLLALRGRELMRNSPLAGSAQQSESLIWAARKRLELWDLSGAQIDEITRTGQPLKNITLHAPTSGYVMARNAFPKQRITPDTELYTVADLSKVWIMADVFENEIPMIRLGLPVRISLSYAGGRALQGRVDYIQPQVDAATRTLKVRIEADNPAMALKPEMFVDVEFQAVMPARVTVLAEAVLNTGLRQTVFVDRGNGFLEPRQVQTGERVGDRIEIKQGLRAGERVVTSGNFLIDSESQLKSAAAGMAGQTHESPGQTSERPSPASAGEHKHD